MKTVTITKELVLLDAQDIEKALSEHFNKEVTLSEVDCQLVYHFHQEIYEGMEAIFYFTVDGDRCDSVDLFFDCDLGRHYLDGTQLALDEPCLPLEQMLNFETSLFKSFDCWIVFS